MNVENQKLQIKKLRQPFLAYVFFAVNYGRILASIFEQKQNMETKM